MAKKKAHKKHVVKRRKVGAIKTDFMEPLAILGGVVAGRLLTKVMPSSIDAKTQPIITTGIGAIGFMFLKNPTAKLVASGVFASGGLQLVQSMGVLNGIMPSGAAPATVGYARRIDKSEQNRGYGGSRLISGNKARMNGGAPQLTPLVVGSF